MSATTVRTTVDELRSLDAVVEQKTTQRGTGRPAQLISINPGLAKVIGVQFEPDRVRVALSNLGLEIESRRERSMRVANDVPTAMDVAAEMVEAMIGAAAVPRERLLGAAIALGAPVDTIDGVVRETTRLPGWVGRRPAEELEERLHLPVDLSNDATLAGLAEAVVGAARGSDPIVYLKLSAKVGCGIVIGGRPYQGFAGTAGELAHVSVDRDGALCFCGNRGCLWTVIGAERIIQELESTTGGSATRLHEASEVDLDQRLQRIIGWATDGDLACEAVLYEVGVHTGQAIAIISNLLNPQTIVIGGTLSTAGDLLIASLRDTAMRYTRHLSQRRTPRPIEIVPAALDQWAEVLGAGAMVLRSSNLRIAGRLQDLLRL